MFKTESKSKESKKPAAHDARNLEAQDIFKSED